MDSPLFEVASVLVRFYHVASFIVNTDHSVRSFRFTSLNGMV